MSDELRKGSACGRGDDATTITLSISREDKIRVKTWAASRGTTVSALLRGWIAETCGERGEG